MAKAKRKTARVRIGDVRWTIRRCPVPKDRWGDCDPEKKLIRVSDKLAGCDLMDVMLHEMIHARWWCLSECEVREFAEEAAGVMELFGFRDRHEEEDDD